jgi:hypothetical protein
VYVGYGHSVGHVWPSPRWWSLGGSCRPKRLYCTLLHVCTAAADAPRVCWPRPRAVPAYALGATSRAMPAVQEVHIGAACGCTPSTAASFLAT